MTRSIDDITLEALQFQADLLTYIPRHVLTEVLEVFKRGAQKDGRYPMAWRDMPYDDAMDKAIGAFVRHTSKDRTLENGELSTDEESGCSHLAHRIANLIMKLDLKRLEIEK